MPEPITLSEAVAITRLNASTIAELAALGDKTHIGLRGRPALELSLGDWKEFHAALSLLLAELERLREEIDHLREALADADIAFTEEATRRAATLSPYGVVPDTVPVPLQLAQRYRRVWYHPWQNEVKSEREELERALAFHFLKFLEGDKDAALSGKEAPKNDG